MIAKAFLNLFGWFRQYLARMSPHLISGSTFKFIIRALKNLARIITKELLGTISKSSENIS